MQQFLELFHPLPGNSYLIVTSKIDQVVFELHKKIKEVDGKFAIALYGEGEFENAKIEYIDDLKKPFKANPRDFDRVIFKDIFSSHQNQTMLLKTAYRALANSAEVIIAEKQNLLDIQKTKELLETCEYRASNHIDDILDGYDVFIAKKMHMWGNGL
jgi:hypothetical protein